MVNEIQHPSTSGIIRTWHPAFRILGGIAMLVAISLLPLNEAKQFAFPVVLLAPWLALCRPNWRLLGKAIPFAVAMFSPLAVYAPFADVPFAPLSIAWRGTASLLVSVAASSAVAVNELRQGLCFLPRTLSTLILQIVLQTTLLSGEVRRISHALLLRGGGMRVLFAFPVVWLSRLLIRADRIGDAMEMRGFE